MLIEVEDVVGSRLLWLAEETVVEATEGDRETDDVRLDWLNWRSIGEGRRSILVSESGLFLFLEDWRYEG